MDFSKANWTGSYGTAIVVSSSELVRDRRSGLDIEINTARYVQLPMH